MTSLTGGFITVSGVLVAAVCDIQTGLIFTPVACAIGATAFGAALIDGTGLASAAGAITVGGALFGLHAMTLGRGIGLGDVRLGCAVGAGLGTAPGFVALGWAFALGGVYGSFLLALRRARRDTEIRFAPFIAAGTLAALIQGTLW